MKVAALTFTSGLGQKTGPRRSTLSVTGLILVTASSLVDETSTSSGSGDPHRELWLLRIRTKSPRTINFISGKLNGGGGGGGIGISGD